MQNKIFKWKQMNQLLTSTEMRSRRWTHTDHSFIMNCMCHCVVCFFFCFSGLITPGGFSSVPAGMETPELIELRKKKIEEAMDG